jgi:hypothetical protein
MLCHLLHQPRQDGLCHCCPIHNEEHAIDDYPSVTSDMAATLQYYLWDLRSGLPMPKQKHGNYKVPIVRRNLSQCGPVAQEMVLIDDILEGLRNLRYPELPKSFKGTAYNDQSRQAQFLNSRPKSITQRSGSSMQPPTQQMLAMPYVVMILPQSALATPDSSAAFLSLVDKLLNMKEDIAGGS